MFALSGLCAGGVAGFVWQQGLSGAATAGAQERMQTQALQIERLRAQLAALDADRAVAEERRQQVADQLTSVQRAYINSTHALEEAEQSLAVLRREAAELRTDHRALRAETERLAGEALSLETALAEATERDRSLDGSMTRVGEAIDAVIMERDFALAHNRALEGEVGELERAAAEARDREERMLARLETATEVGLAGLEQVFRSAEIDLDDLLAQAERDFGGRGGPFAPIGSDGAVAADEDVRVVALLDDLEKISLMRFAADHVPFLRPVNGGRLTSGFGPRRDPFHRRSSMHSGIDIAAPRGTPILATADGIVTFAGRQRGYGKVIEIRHAFGFETLYAHLHEIHVSVGDRVERGDRIGDMGSTGRSTGNHVHYEVRIDSRAVNPMKFIEAARDVL
ncbi:MAG: peptidoglycan DD-metalloendopeptidase family protein [Pseudomonadota bacterium]